MVIYPVNSVVDLLNNWGLSGEFVCGYLGVKGLLCTPQTLRYSSLHFFIDLGSSKLTYGPFLHSAQLSTNIKKNEVEVWVVNFIQMAVFCPPKPRVSAFVSRNEGKVYLFGVAQVCTTSPVQCLMVFFFLRISSLTKQVKEEFYPI